MDIQLFIKKFAEAIEVEDVDALTPETEFHDLDEWSSLIAFTVIAMVKMEYNKTVTGAELRHCNTVEDLYNLIEAK